VHEGPDYATGSWGEASFWRGYCAANLRHPQWVASLCVIIAEEGARENVGYVSIVKLSPFRLDRSLKSWYIFRGKLSLVPFNTLNYFLREFIAQS